METIQLNDNHQLPMIGFGTYKAKEKEGMNAVITALEEGYRLIDSAAIYQNETIVGKAIRKSDLKREEIIVTSKVWREELGYEQTKTAFQNSLEKLQMDYIDLYLIHWPANERNYRNWQQTNSDTWRAMEELQKEGKIKSIGVSNFWPHHLDELLKTAKITPAINQIEFHPGYWQPEVVKYCRNKNIVLEAWSPLARGKVFDNKILKNLSEKYQRSIAQICLRWIIQHNVIPIPKSASVKRIQENMNIFDFQLNSKEVNAIDELPQMGFSGELPDIWPERLTVS